MAVNEQKCAKQEKEKKQETTMADIDFKPLKISSSGTVHPNIMLRTTIFTPVARNSDKGALEHKVRDLTRELIGLEVCAKYGYEKITIKGPRLNIEVDFRIWCGILIAIKRYGCLERSNMVTLRFTEFARMCGYPSKRIDKNLRDLIDASLIRIEEQFLWFRSLDETRKLSTRLLRKAKFDTERDTILLDVDSELWELYKIDRHVFVGLDYFNKVPRSEMAKCLILHFLALPQKPFPISMTKLRERVNLPMENKYANKAIKKGISKLEEIGFLEGEFKKDGGDDYYHLEKKDIDSL